MTMIDEQALRTALRAAADSMAVPDHAVEQILEAAQRLDARSARRFGRRPSVGGDPRAAAPVHPSAKGAVDAASRHRRPSRPVLVAAAAIALVGISVAAASTLGGSPPARLAVPPAPIKTTAGLPARSATAAGHAPATTGTIQLGPPQVTAPTLPPGAVGDSSKVQETGSVDLTVGHGQLQRVLTRLTDLATAEGGFVASTQTQSGDGASNAPSSGDITLQVPQASFGPVVAQAQTFGKVTALTTKGTDVTGQYVDLQARIAALEASRDQYLAIMSRATSISDVLAVQAQLDQLQTQIEQLQGRLQVLDSQTTYGTLVVSVAERGGHETPVRPVRSGIAGAWHAAVSGFTAAFDGLVRIAGPALFVLLCLAALAISGRLAWRGIRRRNL